jgi:hypothetical protein
MKRNIPPGQQKLTAFGFAVADKQNKLPEGVIPAAAYSVQLPPDIQKLFDDACRLLKQRAHLAEPEAAAQKRGPGRPPKPKALTQPDIPQPDQVNATKLIGEAIAFEIRTFGIPYPESWIHFS